MNQTSHSVFKDTSGRKGHNVSYNEFQISEKLLLNLTDCESLSDIRVISLRNKYLNYILKILSQCHNLSIAYLQGNRLSKNEFGLFGFFQKLLKLDLSNNNLKSLPTKQTLSEMISLRFFYLHENVIETWEEMSKLASLPNILHITLFENPCTDINGYRLYMVSLNIIILICRSIRYQHYLP